MHTLAQKVCNYPTGICGYTHHCLVLTSSNSAWLLCTVQYLFPNTLRLTGLYLTKIIVPVLLSTKVEGSCCTIACPATSTHHFMYFDMAMKYANTTYNFHLPSFAWCDEYMTLSTLVNSNSPSVVQHKNSAVFAVTDEKLLSIQLPRQPTKNCVVFIRDD